LKHVPYTGVKLKTQYMRLPGYSSIVHNCCHSNSDEAVLFSPDNRKMKSSRDLSERSDSNNNNSNNNKSRRKRSKLWRLTRKLGEGQMLDIKCFNSNSVHGFSFMNLATA